MQETYQFRDNPRHTSAASQGESALLHDLGVPLLIRVLHRDDNLGLCRGQRAVGNLADALPGDVLWYHADYVAPSWGRRLARVDKIGAHIFYRS